MTSFKAEPLEPFPFELIPTEVVVLIAQYLTVQDLSACCATSRTMRELFSDNFVWKPHCNKELAAYLQSTPCKVKPKFVSPESGDSLLSPVNKWRLAFMRETHLWNNWRQGKYKKEEIQNKHSCSSRDGTICHKFLTNDCVVALYSKRIELLDVREFPAADATQPIPLQAEFTDEYQIHTGNNMIVTVYGTAVQVYFINLPMKEHSLQHEFFFDDSQKISPNNTKKIHEMFYSRRNMQVSKMLQIVVGSLFVGVDGESTLHIWDLKSGLKLKEEACSLKSVVIRSVQFSETMNLVLDVTHRTTNVRTLLAYDLNKLSFLPFQVAMNKNCTFFVIEHYLSIKDSNDCLNVYNCHTFKIVLKDQEKVSEHPRLLLNNLLFVQNKSLKMFNPANGEIETIQVGDIDWFEVFANRFVQITRKYSLTIFEFNEKSKSLKETSMILDFEYYPFYSNKASTRYIVRYRTGFVLHFW